MWLGHLPHSRSLSPPCHRHLCDSQNAPTDPPDLLAHFDRERIPERVVHANGAGAHGEWECTDGLEDTCLAELFKKGTKCPVTIRFSTVGGETGTSDQAR